MLQAICLGPANADEYLRPHPHAVHFQKGQSGNRGGRSRHRCSLSVFYQEESDHDKATTVLLYFSCYLQADTAGRDVDGQVSACGRPGHDGAAGVGSDTMIFHHGDTERR